MRLINITISKGNNKVVLKDGDNYSMREGLAEEIAFSLLYSHFRSCVRTAYDYITTL